jgi:hypothetical protein
MSTRAPDLRPPLALLRATQQDDGMTDLQWQALGHAVAYRLDELGYRSVAKFVDQSGTDFSIKTIRRLVNGGKVSRSTLINVEKYLFWGPGSMDAILAGKKPFPKKVEPVTDDERILWDTLVQLNVDQIDRVEHIALFRAHASKSDSAESAGA